MPEVIIQRLDETRKAHANIYVPKIEIGTSFFRSKREGLLYHADSAKTWTRKILPELNRIEQHNLHYSANNLRIIDAVIFPELSIPGACVEELAQWTRKANVLVVAGSHYERVDDGWRAACPVVVNGITHFTYKTIPSPFEDSGIDDQGLQPGLTIKKFRNSRIGNFVVFVCSDYLDEPTRQELIDDDTDIFIVIACQRGVEKHYAQAALDCQKSQRGVYVVYSNLQFGKYGEGKSALFGQAHRDFEPHFKRLGYSDLVPREKLWVSASRLPSAIVSLDLNERRPSASKTTRTRANVSIIAPFDHKPRGSGVVQGAADDRAYKLVAFDLDGTLLRGEGIIYSWAAVWERLAGDADGLKWRDLMRSFMRGIITYEKWCNTAAIEFRSKGITASQIIALAKTFKLVDNCNTVLKQLKTEGYKLVLLSGGMDVFLTASGIDAKLFDYVHVNKIGFDSEGVILSVISTAYDFEGKSTAICEICEAEGISLEDVVYVGDSINDKSLLKIVGCFISFPANDPEISMTANIDIPERDLLEVYRVIQLGKPEGKG